MNASSPAPVSGLRGLSSTSRSPRSVFTSGTSTETIKKSPSSVSARTRLSGVSSSAASGVTKQSATAHMHASKIIFLMSSPSYTCSLLPIFDGQPAEVFCGGSRMNRDCLTRYLNVPR